MRIVFYISGHGFGHASRDIELIGAILTRRPDARITVRTTAPRWLFDLYADERVDVQAVEADTGVVQIDSLRLDEEATARAAASFYAEFDRRVAEETEVLRQAGATLVLGDIPPLAFAAAACADVPGIAIGNFTWDWIYAAYPAFERLAPDVLPMIREAYATSTLALRLPLHGGFDAMAASHATSHSSRAGPSAPGTRFVACWACPTTVRRCSSRSAGMAPIFRWIGS